MPIGEVFLGAFITVLLERLATRAFIKLARSAGVIKKLNKVKADFELIQAVLADAGQKQIREESVRKWLQKLQLLAYDMDDIVDDLSTEVMRRQFNRETYSNNRAKKVSRFFPDNAHALKYGVKMSSRVDKITARLKALIEEKGILGLNDNVAESSTRRPEVTSLIDESKVIGRVDDKTALLRMLLGGECECSSSHNPNFNVVSIVGQGGIGKSFLAQLLYNDKDVQKHFDVKSWVSVSDSFDVFAITKAIFKDLNGEDKDFETLNHLQVVLKEKLKNKKFLIVLDDVWSESHADWERLKQPFTQAASGSRVLVTTRKTKVGEAMDSVQDYPLWLLSDEDALSLFAQHATSDVHNFNVSEKLSLYGEDILKKCGRLPLALKILGRAFRGKPNDEEWVELLNSEIWGSHNGNDEILPALMLSYYDLPPHLKQLFAYCCLFPKDYIFKKDELVLLWMGEGFLYPTHPNKSMESVGRNCFEELVSRSFFQQYATDGTLFTMHDLLNELAMIVAREFFLVNDDKTDIPGGNVALEKFHHFAFYCERKVTYIKFKPLESASRLRTFLQFGFVGDGPHVGDKVITELVPKLRFLRVLSLPYRISKLPRSIGRLKHLRYLNLSSTCITCLPEEVLELYNLQTLLLSGCYQLSNLPNGIEKLTNLRHLDISSTPKLNKLSSGIGGLKYLQTLSKVIIGEGDDFKLSDLKGLVHLNGQLSIKGLHKVKNAVEAKEANLEQKKGIVGLNMEWDDEFDSSRSETTEHQVLEGLRPFEKLIGLKIVNYMGTKFPSWTGEGSFACLTEVTLSYCRGAKCLPALGNLPLLRQLIVEGMDGLERVGKEFLRPSGSCGGVPFPSLEVLKFYDMKEWEEWSSEAGVFPCLRKIDINDCPKLDVVALDSIPTLQVLRVRKCSVYVLRRLISVCSSIARLKLIRIKGLTQFDGEVLEKLKEVEFLGIWNCDELKHLWESEESAFEILRRLQELKIHDCQDLKSFGEIEVNQVTSMNCLTKVEIQVCPKLERYNCTNSIEMLDIDGCESLTSLTFSTMDDLPSTLKSVRILGCEKVEVSWPRNNFLSSVEHLTFERCHSLRLFPESFLVHLTSLNIRDCDHIESIPDDGYGILPFHCLRDFEIDNCKNLKSFPHSHLQSLSSLNKMSIVGCPSLDESFPCGLWPPNLSFLYIGNLKKPISEWGQQNFPTSLVTLNLYGENSGVVSFAAEEDMSGSLVLPSFLIELNLRKFKELESLSTGLQHLTCLQRLFIMRCEKLIDLPETVFPKLSSLIVHSCSPRLVKKYRKRNGKYRSIISQIPRISLSDTDSFWE